MRLKRKTMTVVVTVTCPGDMTPAFVRRELRHMTGGFSWAGEEVRVRSVRPYREPVT